MSRSWSLSFFGAAFWSAAGAFWSAGAGLEAAGAPLFWSAGACVWAIICGGFELLEPVLLFGVLELSGVVEGEVEGEAD